jgi:transcriptional regulator with XRE-family HTH domain
MNEHTIPLRDLLRKRREGKKLSQRQAARMIGITQPSLSECERRNADHQVGTWAQWASGLGCEFGVYIVIDGEHHSFPCTEQFD